MTLEIFSLSLEIGIFVCCAYACFLERQVRDILQKEYEYDKEIYEAVLLKKMITQRRSKKVTIETEKKEESNSSVAH